MKGRIILLVAIVAGLALTSTALADKPNDDNGPGGSAVIELWEQPTDHNGNPTGPKVKIKEENVNGTHARIRSPQVASVAPGCKDVLVRWTQKDWTSLRTLWYFDHGVNFCWNDSLNKITGINRRYAVGYAPDGAWTWTGNINPVSYWFPWRAGYPYSGHYATRTGVFEYGKPPIVLTRSYATGKIELHENSTWIGQATCQNC